MIIKKTAAEIDAMAKAGDIHVRTMHLLAGKIRPGITTGETGPTGKVRAASATQPSSTTPTSIEMMSPRSSRYGPGMPWTTIAFGEAQIEPGKPR